MMEKVELMKHIKDHVQYPAKKQDIIEMCNRMEHVDKKDRKWLEKELPDREYKSAEEVMAALGMKSAGTEM